MYRASHVIASTGSITYIKGNTTTVTMALNNSADIHKVFTQLHTGRPQYRFSLHFEHIRSDAALPVIDVYLHPGPEQEIKEKYHIGALALYGLAESTAGTEGHDGEGQDRVMDAGAVFATFASLKDWPRSQFTLSLVPARALPPDAVLTIEKIALYVHEL